MDNDSLKTMSWRERLYVIIFFTNTPAGKRFDTWLLVIILASLVAVSYTHLTLPTNREV